MSNDILNRAQVRAAIKFGTPHQANLRDAKISGLPGQDKNDMDIITQKGMEK